MIHKRNAVLSDVDILNTMVESKHLIRVHTEAVEPSTVEKEKAERNAGFLDMESNKFDFKNLTILKFSPLAKQGKILSV